MAAAGRVSPVLKCRYDFERELILQQFILAEVAGPLLEEIFFVIEAYFRVDELFAEAEVDPDCDPVRIDGLDRKSVV